MREYLQVEALAVDLAMSLVLKVWVATWSANWLVTIRPEVNRFAYHFFVFRRLLTLLMSRYYALVTVISCNIAYASFLLLSIHWVNAQLQQSDIRALQIVISRSSIEVRKVYRALTGKVTRISPSSPKHLNGNDTCPICIEALIPSTRSAHPTITAAVHHPRQHLSARSKAAQGVLTIHTTPCGHNYHEECLSSIPTRSCPLCKAVIGRTSLIALPYLPW